MFFHYNYMFLVDWLIDFNGFSTCFGLFYVKRKGIASIVRVYLHFFI